MIKTLLFWLFVTLDGAALGLVFVLGLAAAKPSHTSPIAVVGFFLLPALLLVALILVFHRAPWPAARTAALVVAGLPVVVVVGGALMSNGVAWILGSSEKLAARPDPAIQVRIEAAVSAHDAAVAGRLASENKARINHAATLIMAIRQLEKSPGPPDVLRSLLQAGLQPNSGGSDEAPLAAAIRASRILGAEPVLLLLRAGADPNARGGAQPPYFAALARKTDPVVLPMLLEQGADLRALDMAGGSAVYWALFHQNWSAAVLLVERGAAWQQVRLPDGRDMRQSVASALQRSPADADLLQLARLIQAGTSQK